MTKSPKSRPALANHIHAKACRRQQAKQRKKPNIWSGLGLFGLVGWAVIVPVLLGITLGIWLDRIWPGRISWTLSGLIVGVAWGCRQAWCWIEQARQDKNDER